MQEKHKWYAKNDKKQMIVQENDVTRCVNSEANDAADLNEDKSIDTEQGVKDGRQNFEVFVVLQEDERNIAALSSIEGSDEG